MKNKLKKILKHAVENGWDPKVYANFRVTGFDPNEAILLDGDRRLSPDELVRCPEYGLLEAIYGSADYEWWRFMAANPVPNWEVHARIFSTKPLKYIVDEIYNYITK